MKTLAPFLISIFFPGVGHIIIRHYWRGILIFVLALGSWYFFAVSIFLFVIIALVDLYYILEKENGRKATTRRLVFSLLLALIVLPGLFYAFGISLLLSTEYVTDHYFNEKHTISEMDNIADVLETYRHRNDRYPVDYETFVNSKPIWKSWRTDNWNNRYKYDLKDSSCYRLISAGEDQKYGTKDDLIKKCEN